MRVKVVPTLLALVGVGVGYGVLSTVFARGAGYGIATSAPAETAIWIEARDARTAIETFRSASCFAEFQRSNSMKQLEKGWKELISINESPVMADWKALGLDVSEETVMLGLGQNVAIGAMVPRPTGQPSLYFATKIDVVGLAKKVAVSGDWTALWDKLQTVLGGKDAPVELYKDYKLVTRATGGVEVTFCLIRDLLVASPDKDTVKALVDVHLGQRETLASRKAFKDELDALPASPAGVTWVDLELLRDKDRLVAAIKGAAGRVGAEEMVKEFDGTELSVLQADLADRGGVAWAMYVPHGELYSARLELSRPDSLFKDQKEHDLRALLSDQTVVYGEARGVYPLFEGFFASETLKAIRATPAWKWVAAKLEKPSQLGEMVPGALPPVPELDNDPSFELKLSAALLQLPLRELLGNDLAMALEIHEANKLEDGLAPSFFLRSRPLIRLLTDLGAGVMVAQQKRGMPTIEVITHGKRTIYGYVGDKPGVYFTQLGAELCASTKKEMVQRLIDACDGGSTGLPSAVQKNLTRLPDGYQFFAYYDLKKYMAGMQKLMPMGEEEKKAMQAFNGADSMAVAAYVSQDYSSYTMRAWQPYASDAAPEFKQLYANCDPQPLAWSKLPDTTFLSAAMKLDPKALVALFEKVLPAEAQKEKDKALEGFGKQFLGGKHPMKDLLAHLGDEVGFGVLSQGRLAPAGAKPEATENLVAVPGGVLAIELSDAVAFEPTWKELTASLVKQMNSARARGGDAVVRGTLMTITTAQALFREGDKENDQNLDYGTLQELAECYLVDPELASGLKDGWLYEVRPSKTTPEFLWMATARRNGAGPKDVTYVTNHSGVIVEVDGPVELTDECEFPKDAVPMGSRPPKPVAIDPNDPTVAAIVEKKIGEVEKASTLRLPASEREQMAPIVGDGFTPCWAINAGWLYIASSEHALERALAATEGSGSLAASGDMKRIIGKNPRDVAFFTHLSWRGIADQVNQNALLLAQNLAPPPAELAAPKAPEFPSDLPEDPEAQQKAFEKYQAESDAWQKAMEGHPQKVAAWRKEHAAENAKALAPMIGSLRVLGHVVGWGRVDGEGIESFQELKLDPNAQTSQ